MVKWSTILVEVHSGVLPKFAVFLSPDVLFIANDIHNFLLENLFIILQLKDPL